MNNRRLKKVWTLALSITTALGSAAGCNQKPQESEVSANTSAAKASTSCADYASKLCAQTGEDSSLCGATKVATGVMAPKACAAALQDFQVTAGLIKDQRKGCDGLVAKLCKEEGETSSVCSVVKEKISQVPADACGELMEHYAEVKEQLKQVAKAEAPLSPEARAKIESGQAPGFGPPNAKVTLVEFSDFECPYCSRAALATEQIRQKYGEKVRFIFRQFPLPMHANAKKAAEAALAAHAQGKFWELHDLMFKNQRQLGPSDLEGYAKEVGLNVATFKDALAKDQYAAQVAADLKLGEEVSVNGTPTLFVNGKRIQNPSDFAAISSVIDELLKSAG